MIIAHYYDYHCNKRGRVLWTANRKCISDRLITSALEHRERAIFMTGDKKRSQERAQGKIVVDNVINYRLSLMPWNVARYDRTRNTREVSLSHGKRDRAASIESSIPSVPGSRDVR